MSISTITTARPTTFLPDVQDASGLRGLLSEHTGLPDFMQFPGVASARMIAGASRAYLTALAETALAAGFPPEEWGSAASPTALQTVPSSEIDSLNMVRRLATEQWSSPRTDAPGRGACFATALYAPLPEVAGVDPATLPLALVTPLDTAAHLAALDGHTPRVHLHSTASEAACTTCTYTAAHAAIWPSAQAFTWTSAQVSQSWTPLAEWATRDGLDKHYTALAAPLEVGTPTRRLLEDKAFAWAKGRDVLEAHAIEYVQQLRDELLTEWADWRPPATSPEPSPSRSVLWH
jgi:hypothetical protein